MKTDFMDNLRTMCLLLEHFVLHYSKGDYQQGFENIPAIIDSAVTQH